MGTKKIQTEEFAERRKLKRAQLTAVVLGISSLLSILFFVFAQIQTIEAKKNYQLVLHLQKELEEQKALAERNREIAIQNENMAKANELNAQKALEECQKRKK